MSFPSTAVDCGTLSNPANGQVSHPKGTTVGQRANYSCDPGYILMMEDSTHINPRTCRADGLWSGVALTCSCKLYCCVYACLCIHKHTVIKCTFASSGTITGSKHALDNKVCLMLLFIHVCPYLYTAVSISLDTSDSVPVLASSAAVAGGLIIAAIAVMTTIICVCVMKRKKGRYKLPVQQVQSNS